MSDSSFTSALPISISAVERDTGLSKDTLRVWERRYQFPQPERDSLGERLYPVEQVKKLRILRRLMDVGHRPGKIIGLSLDELQRLAEIASNAANPPHSHQHEAELQNFMSLIKRHEIESLRHQLLQTLLKMGLAQFVIDIVAPLNVRVGEAWARGYLEIFEEHLYTESIQVVMRNAISTIPQSRRQPRVLLTTFPQESHGLGLLMAEALFSLEGARCISLGVQTPIWDIALAAGAQRADAVALSFSSAINPNVVNEGLVELRHKLPETIDIWVGGNCPVLQKKTLSGITVLHSLQDIPEQILRWRRRHALT